MISSTTERNLGLNERARDPPFGAVAGTELKEPAAVQIRAICAYLRVMRCVGHGWRAEWAFCAPHGQWACSKLRPRPGQGLAVHERLHPARGLQRRRSFSHSLGYSRLK